MKTSNNSLADNEVAKNDTPDALISDNDLLKFFNLERENVQDFSITHRKDGMYVNITLNKTWVQCPVCGHMTSRVKDYTDKKITHSVLSTTNCYIVYHARRYQCPHCKKTFYENNPFTFGGKLCCYCIQCSQRSQVSKCNIHRCRQKIRYIHYICY